MKIVVTGQKNLHIFPKELNNFNETFKKGVLSDNINS